MHLRNYFFLKDKISAMNISSLRLVLSLEIISRIPNKIQGKQEVRENT